MEDKNLFWLQIILTIVVLGAEGGKIYISMKNIETEEREDYHQNTKTFIVLELVQIICILLFLFTLAFKA
jgi:heme/copper-type cytochrome/quinol oxidase subunit 2